MAADADAPAGADPAAEELLARMLDARRYRAAAGHLGPDVESGLRRQGADAACVQTGDQQLVFGGEDRAASALDGEASCYFHAHKRAAVPCDGCGRFLCSLCDLNFFSDEGVCLFKLGIPLGELFLLSDLADWLRANGRSRFLFTAPPLRLPGAVGSPVTGVGTV